MLQNSHSDSSLEQQELELCEVRRRIPRYTGDKDAEGGTVRRWIRKTHEGVRGRATDKKWPVSAVTEHTRDDMAAQNTT